MGNNPFAPVDLNNLKVKVLVFGAGKTGKTQMALSAPVPAVADSDGGCSFYAGKEGISRFHRAPIATVEQLDSLVDFIESDGGKTYQTFIIDQQSSIEDDFRNRYKDQRGHLGYAEHGKVNARFKLLYTRLLHLPVNVVMIAREEKNYLVENKVVKLAPPILPGAPAGIKPEVTHAAIYFPDFVIRMMGDHTGELWAARGAKGVTLPKVLKAPVTWDTIQRLNALLIGAGRKGWVFEDVLPEIESMFNHRNHAVNTLKLMVQNGLVDDTLTVLEVVGRVKEYVETRHPERVGDWWKDPQTLKEMDDFLMGAYQLTAQQFCETVKVDFKLYDSPAEFMGHVENWMSQPK